MGHYILIDGVAVLEPDVMKWADWMDYGGSDETHPRFLARTEVGDVRVSTVFLGIDHNWSREGPPILWETMVFGGEHDDYCKRYPTPEEAKKGHAFAVMLAKGEVKDD